MKNNKYIYIFFIFTYLFLVNERAYSDNLDLFGMDKSSEFYVSPVVNVIISGLDKNHVRNVLERIISLSKKVPVRNIVLYHYESEINNLSYQFEGEDEKNRIFRELGISKPQNPYSAYLKDLKLSSLELKGGDNLLNRLRVSYSPVWIVRHEGKDYVYEGYPDISKMFSRDGTFIPEE